MLIQLDQLSLFENGVLSVPAGSKAAGDLRNNCRTLKLARRIPMKLDKERGLWILQKELPEGRYEYKYVVDGEWTCNYYELVTPANKDGHVNNYVQVTDDDPNSITAALRARMTSNDPNLTTSERLQIRQFLEAYQLEG
ncbi:hypothetical protein C3L33_02732, partial [Rhododendron williamsianum]